MSNQYDNIERVLEEIKPKYNTGNLDNETILREVALYYLMDFQRPVFKNPMSPKEAIEIQRKPIEEQYLIILDNILLRKPSKHKESISYNFWSMHESFISK